MMCSQIASLDRLARPLYRLARDGGVSIIVTAMSMSMSAFVLAAVQAVIVVVMLMLINHFPFDDGVLGTFGSNCRTRGAADGAPDDGPVPSADGRTHGSPGAATERAADYGVAIDAAAESGRREGGQGEEDESLLACHVDPFR